MRRWRNFEFVCSRRRCILPGRVASVSTKWWIKSVFQVCELDHEAFIIIHKQWHSGSQLRLFQLVKNEENFFFHHRTYANVSVTVVCHHQCHSLSSHGSGCHFSYFDAGDSSDRLWSKYGSCLLESHRNKFVSLLTLLCRCQHFKCFSIIGKWNHCTDPSSSVPYIAIHEVTSSYFQKFTRNILSTIIHVVNQFGIGLQGSGDLST